MVKQKARPPRSTTRNFAALEPWPPPKLAEYLRQIQSRYRARGVPFPKSGQELAEEARRNIFNANHIMALFNGWAGPWLDPQQPNVHGALVFIRNQLKKLRNPELPEALRRARAGRALHNRQVGHAKRAVKAVSFKRNTSRGRILKVLDAQILPLRPVSPRNPRLGITRAPGLPETKQAFWKPIANHVVRYLERSCGGAPEKTRCKIAAEILHLASHGAFPNGARGTANVKALYYRSL
jgi:hypothetical protein